MNGNIFELNQSSAFLTSGSDVRLQIFLRSCSEQGALNHKGNVDSIVKIINTSLNSSFDKEKGLSYLIALIPQITIEAYSDNAISWMVHCNKIINHEPVLDRLALNTLGSLLKLSLHFPEIYKDTAKQIVPKFLLDHVRRRKTSEVSVAFLECLSNCIQEYSGPSGEFKNDLVKLVCSRSVVEGKREVVRAAARCVALLPQIGGGGKQGVSHKTSWYDQQLSLVSVLHTLLDDLYQHTNIIGDGTKEDFQNQIFLLEAIDEKDVLMKIQRLATQFESVSQYLQGMLLEEFPVSKQVSLDAILDVIVHAQKPTHTTLGTSREELAVLSVFPTIQVASMRLLESLILCLGRNLIPQGGLINFLCSQAIVWTHKQHENWPYAMEKPYRQTRLAAYCCLHSWLGVAGSSSHVEVLLDKPLAIMLADVHTEKPTVKLRVGSKSSKGRKQQTLVSEEERSEKLGDHSANRRLCERALLTLTLLLRAAAAHIKPSTYMKVQSTVLRVMEEMPVPYIEVSCLSGLYQLLLTLCMETPPNVAPPHAIALTAFSAGLHHPAIQVKTACLAGISYLEKIIHPVAATLYFPLPQEVTDNQQDFFEPEMKKRKVDFVQPDELDDSIVLELTEDETEVKDSVVVDEQMFESSESNDSVEVTYAHIQEKKTQKKSAEIDSDIQIVKQIEICTEDIDDSQDEEMGEDLEGDDDFSLKLDVSNSANDADINVMGDQNFTSVNDGSCSDKICTNTTSQDENPTETVKCGTISETKDEDLSQMLLDFNDEVEDK